MSSAASRRLHPVDALSHPTQHGRGGCLQVFGLGGGSHRGEHGRQTGALHQAGPGVSEVRGVVREEVKSCHGHLVLGSIH